MMKNKRVSAKHAVSYRNYRRARERALSKLAQSYPETYKELLEQEKVSDQETGAKWFAIDGDSDIAVGIRSGSDTSGRQTRDYYKEDEGDYGGEA